MSTTTVQQLIKMPAEVDENNPKKFVFPCDIGTDYTFKRDIVWKNVFGFIVLHLGAFYGLYLAFTEVKWLTVPYVWILIFITGEGVTAGAHRLYSHKSYKAALPFRIILLILQTMAGQNCMYIWVRDHRQHHKYSDTDADPHNSNRGFFFCHMGWLMSKKHPLVKEKGKTIDMSDLEADPWVMFQKKHYKTLYFIFALIIPVYFPVLFWNETLWNSFFTSYFLRYVTLLHITWTVNSIAHFYGTKPFDKFIRPTQSQLVACCAFGEGWHNYHHAFAWDYKAGEFGKSFNLTTVIINSLSSFGIAYELKEVPVKLVKYKAMKSGNMHTAHLN